MKSERKAFRYVGFLQDNEPVKVYPDIKPFSFRTQCCDCGLTHDVTIATREDHLEFRFKRNEKVTALHRRDRVIRRLKGGK